MLQLIALTTMLIDHIGAIFIPQEALLRIIGRLSMPLYVYGCLMGLKHTSNFKRYFTRLLIIALISQIPYILAFNKYELNIVFNLLVSVMVCKLQEKEKIIAYSSIFFAIPLVFFMDYGIYCLFLMLGYYYIKHPITILVFHATLNYFIAKYCYDWAFQSYSIGATLIILCKNYLPKIRINKHFYRSFYPAHLLILGLIAIMIGSRHFPPQ